MANLKYINKNDKVMTDGNSGFCNGGLEKVEKISFRYDEDTGKKYKVIHLSHNRLFDSRTGDAITPPMAYYIYDI